MADELFDDLKKNPQSIDGGFKKVPNTLDPFLSKDGKGKGVAANKQCLGDIQSEPNIDINWLKKQPVPFFVLVAVFSSLASHDLRFLKVIPFLFVFRIISIGIKWVHYFISATPLNEVRQNSKFLLRRAANQAKKSQDGGYGRRVTEGVALQCARTYSPAVADFVRDTKKKIHEDWSNYT
eukprot:CAMPEP_0198288148 /NCGR_PEP_ID=MMETSP1449-20131203/6762_1 /TAXON_ID=420275 /ORGANISM="Attheya septentrionalis, Strain CCMP2084" /LENGTH=179 /DNA_ID=CAMNT_0043986259 /DNA_START=232 /DNA_END=771 /DNA_ORIENTATION=+